HVATLVVSPVVAHTQRTSAPDSGHIAILPVPVGASVVIGYIGTRVRDIADGAHHGGYRRNVVSGRIEPVTGWVMVSCPSPLSVCRQEDPCSYLPRRHAGSGNRVRTRLRRAWALRAGGLAVVEPV